MFQPNFPQITQLYTDATDALEAHQQNGADSSTMADVTVCWELNFGNGDRGIAGVFWDGYYPEYVPFVIDTDGFVYIDRNHQTPDLNYAVNKATEFASERLGTTAA